MHPKVKLILFETGCAENVDIVSGRSWCEQLRIVENSLPIDAFLYKQGFSTTHLFPRITYNEEHKLSNATKATGNDIKDI